MVADAVLGIDLGSTSLRAFIWCPSKNAEFYVENRSRSNLKYSRYEKSDFSSIGYPFDDGEVYIGDIPDPERRSTSLKFGFYVLADASDELVEQYPLVKPLLDRKTDVDFRERLSHGLANLLSTIQVRVSQICKAKRLKITTIGLSIPAQWNLDFETIYEELVSDIFSHPRSEIYFHTETEALAHYLFRNHQDELQDTGAHDVLLFLDFGGHNMNGCMFKVVYGRDGTPNFFRAGDSFGAGGGSEQWEFNIGLVCDNYLKRFDNAHFSAKQRQSLLDKFNREKTTLGPGNSKTITLWINNDGDPWKMMLEPEDIDKCFEDALRAPLEVAAERIARLSEMKGQSRRVIISGGTSRNHALQSRLRQLCADASLPEPVFTDELEICYETAKIAKGVAYAAGNCRTVTDFFQGGAAFGLQMRQHAPAGNSNPGHLWDNYAEFLMDTERQKSTGNKVTGQDELKIVCDPFWSATDPKGVDDVLQHDRCYDILHLGKPIRGIWYFKLTLTGSGDSMFLSIQASRKSFKSTRVQFKDTTVLPLQFDRGTNCVYVGVRGRSLEELDLIKWLGVEDIDDTSPSTSQALLPQEQHDDMNSIIVDLEHYDIPLQSSDPGESRLEMTTTSGYVQLLRAQTAIPQLTEPRFKPSGSLRRPNFERVDFLPGK